MKKIREIYFKIFRHYRILERRCVTYSQADKLIIDNAQGEEQDKWHLDTEYENGNMAVGIVFLCRKERIKC